MIIYKLNKFSRSLTQSRFKTISESIGAEFYSFKSNCKVIILSTLGFYLLTSYI